MGCFAVFVLMLVLYRKSIHLTFRCDANILFTSTVYIWVGMRVWVELNCHMLQKELGNESQTCGKCHLAKSQ